MQSLAKTFVNPRRSAVALAVAGILASGSTWAAEADDELSEVVVTASRREELLSKVPVSVAAITQEQMDVQGLKEIDNIARYTPGLKLDRAGNGGNNISIRGISSGAGAGTTGIYIDDTPIQVRSLGYSSGNLFPTLFDLERVEVLRGPQGTLFGAGSEGGTVRFLQVQPDVDSPALYARAEYAFQDGGDPLYEMGAAYGAPLVDGRIGFRVSAFHRKEGGWIDGVYGTPTILDPTGNAGPNSSATFSDVTVQRPDMNSNSVTGFRGALKFQFSDDLSVMPSLTYQKSERADGFDGFWSALSSKGHYARPVFSATPATASNRFTNITSPDEDKGKDTFVLPQVAINWDVGSVSLVSNTSYFDRKFRQYFDFTNYYVGFYDATPTKFPRPGDKSSSLYDNRQKNLVQEVRLQSNDNDARLTWVTGLYFQQSKQRGIQDIGENFLGKAPELGWFFLPPFVPRAVNDGDPFGPGSTAYQNWFGVVGDPNTSSIWSIDFGSKDTQYAVFAETQFKITEKLKLITGLRISRNKVDFHADYADPENNLNAPLGGIGVIPPQAAAYSTVALKVAENAYTPKFGLSYQIDDRNMVYTTAAKGFRPPGASQRLPVGCGQELIDLGYVDGNGDPAQKFRYKSDTVWSYEIGTKNRMFNNHLSLDASAYHILWKDIQTSVFLPNCGESFVDNGSKAKSEGFDIGLQVRTFRSLSVTVNVGFNNTTFLGDFLSPGGGPLNVKGDHLNGSPPAWVYSLSPQYDFQFLGDRPLFIRFDLSGSSQGRGTQALNGRPPVAGNGLLSARIGTQIGGAEVQLFANNLTNRAPDLTLNKGGLFGGFQNAFWTNSSVRPRTVGIFVSYRQ
ncbi:MAG: TonB-dependent receptor [Pseudomonadota bacterium]